MSQIDSISSVSRTQEETYRNWFQDPAYQAGIKKGVESFGSEDKKRHEEAQENIRKQEEALGFSTQSTISSF